MNRQDVEKSIARYLKPIFGFALKRCKSIHDAEDLSQEIAIRAFRSLIVRDDVADMGKFIWTVAHNMLSNYYRDTAKSMVGVSIDELAELIAAPCSELDTVKNAEKNAALNGLLDRFSYLCGEPAVPPFFFGIARCVPGVRGADIHQRPVSRRLLILSDFCEGFIGRRVVVAFAVISANSHTHSTLDTVRSCHPDRC